MRKINFTLAMGAFFCASFAFAQTTENKWLIGVGAHAVDFKAGRGSDGFFETKNWSTIPPLSKLTVGRNLNRSFNLDLEASVGEVTNKRLSDPTGVKGTPIKDEFFVLAGLGLRYKFANGYIMKENSWFDPYLRVGVNYHSLDYEGVNISKTNAFTSSTEVSAGTKGSVVYNGTTYDLLEQEFKGKKDMFAVSAGSGINLWITKSFGLNVASQYVFMPSFKQDYANFVQHSASLIFKFGNSDRDKDGIKDKDDACPDVFGLAEFKGCPDTDGDGIKDDEDKCPTVAGPKENAGCPWPDTDGDGVTDNLDKCPTVAGPSENAGCPWADTDGDGLTDNVDACPTVACPKGQRGCQDNGCPVDNKKVANDSQESLRGILFDTNKATIKAESEPKLQSAANLINQSTSKFFVDGYTDSSGNDKANLILSEKRAASVVKSLEKDGVESGRLIPRGFGEADPICPANDTPACKQENRRVQVSIATDSDYDEYKAKLEAAVKKVGKKGKKAIVTKTVTTTNTVKDEVKTTVKEVKADAKKVVEKVKTVSKEVKTSAVKAIK